MALFAILAFEDESAWADLDPQQVEAAQQPYADYSQLLAEGGYARGWQVLDGSAAARTVRVREGQTLSTDGPFIESKEALGGWYLVEARDMAHAVELAAQCPSAHVGTTQVHPVAMSSNLG